GPMRAVMAPRWSWRRSTSTATTPPKARCIRSADSIGSGFSTPARASTPANVVLPSATEDHVLSFAEYPLGTERHDDNQHDTHHHGGHRLPGVGAAEEVRQPSLGVHLRQGRPGAPEDHPVDHRPDEGPDP